MTGLFALVFFLAACSVDTDNDGVNDSLDCEPANPRISPDAEEICDGIDNNCNGQIDEEVAILAYWDRDGDGFGDDDKVRRVCTMPDDGVLIGGDCNDTNELIHPGAFELCDEVDNDCNELVDDSVQRSFFLDSDGDGHGDPNSSTDQCIAPTGYVASSDDCNDNEPAAWTGHEEYCDGIDNDCNGLTDENIELSRFWRDADGDGGGDPSTPVVACGPSSTIADNALDCDDSNPAIGPNSREIPGNNTDEDCDGFLSELAVGPNEPFATVAEALLSASNGDVIQLGTGFFVESVDLRGKNVTLAGEGCGNTTLYGDGVASVVQSDGATVTQLTIAGGLGTNINDLQQGGGVIVYPGGGSTTLSEVCLQANRADRGGGISVQPGAELDLNGSYLYDNHAVESGGGVHLAQNSTATVKTTEFISNLTTGGAGAGILSLGADLTVSNSIFAANVCPSYSDSCAVWASAYHTVLTAQVFNEDTQEYEEREIFGLYPDDVEGSATVQFSTFHANEGADDGIAIHARGLTLTAQNNLFTNHPNNVSVLGTTSINDMVRTNEDDLDVGILEWEVISGRLFTGGLVAEANGFSGNGVDQEWGVYRENRITGHPKYVNIASEDPRDWDLRLLPTSDFFNVQYADAESTGQLGAYGGQAPLEIVDTISDFDSDGLSDLVELFVGTNPYVADANTDGDLDGLSALEEWSHGTTDFNADSDEDGVLDADDPNPLLPTDQAPVADAGPDLVVFADGPVQLSALGSFDPNQDPLHFTWELVQAPSGSVLTDVDDINSALTSFTPDDDGDFIFRVIVDDGKVSATDEITISVVFGPIVPDQYATISEAIENLQQNEGIGVRPGVYQTNAHISDAEVTIIGLTHDASEVILHGMGNGSVFHSENSDLRLANLTITHGVAPSGGGVFASLGSVTASNVHFVNNRSDSAGGGIYGIDSFVDVSNCLFSRNYAETDGGGIYSEASHSILDSVGYPVLFRATSSVFTDNTTASDGGGIFVKQSTNITSRFDEIQIHNNVFAYNELLFNDFTTPRRGVGGAVGVVGAGSDLLLSHNLAFSNMARRTFYQNTGRMHVTSNIAAFEDSEEVYSGNTTYNTHITNHNSVFFENIGLDYHADAEMSLYDGDNQHINPQIIGWTADSTANDAVFAVAPALIDQGFFDELDLDGSRSDIGPCGGPLAAASCPAHWLDSDGDGMIDEWEIWAGLSPTTADADADSDSDGLSNLEEYLLGTHPLRLDTDSDGVSDAQEIENDSQPNNDRDNRPTVVTPTQTRQFVGTEVTVIPEASDPNGDLLTYEWRIDQLPSGSSLTNEDLIIDSSGEMSFTLDAPGAYSFVVVASDGLADSVPAYAFAYGNRYLEVPGIYPSLEDALVDYHLGDVVRFAEGVWPIHLEVIDEQDIIIGGFGDETIFVPADAGAQAFVVNSASLTIQDASVIGAVGAKEGGAVLCQSGTLALRRVRFENNLAKDGAALFADDCSTTTIQCNFIDNEASQSGIFYTAGGSWNDVASRFTNNRSIIGSGAATYLSGTDVVLNNTLFDNNTSPNQGAAIYHADLGVAIADAIVGSLTANHLTLVGNSGLSAISFESRTADYSLQNSLFASNSASKFIKLEGQNTSYVFANNGFEDIDSSVLISAATVFSNVYDRPDFVDQPNQDYRLHLRSPMVDRGSGLDLDGSASDIGAFGGLFAPLEWDEFLFDSDGDGMPDTWEVDNGLDPAVKDASSDLDGDGADAIFEYYYNTNPNSLDTDGDGVDDLVEIADPDMDPLVFNDLPYVRDIDDQVVDLGEVTLSGYPIPDATISWRFLEVPPTSSVNNTDLSDPTSNTPTFTADVPGRYILEYGLTNSGPIQTTSTSIWVRGDISVPEDYPTVSWATDSVATGHTVTIAQGTWPAIIRPNGRDITIIGQGQLTVLDGEDNNQVLVADSGEQLTVQAVTFTRGFGVEGGAIALSDSVVLTLNDVILVDNIAVYGAALHATSSSVTASDTQWIDNISTISAGALHIKGTEFHESLLNIERSLVAGNIAMSESGGGLYIDTTNATLQNMVISNNLAALGGGGVAIYGSSDVSLSQITATENDGPVAGFLYQAGSGTNLSIDHSIIAHHESPEMEPPPALFTFDTATIASTLFAANTLNTNLDSEAVPLLIDGENGVQLVADVLWSGFVFDNDWRTNSWTLDPASPAVNADATVTDVDETDGDLGAFGGPAGDWSVQ